jgi:cell division protein ZapA
MGRESVQVKIFGTEYTLKSDTDIEYVKKVAEVVDERMRKLSETSTIKTPSKLAVLTALNIADELYQFRLRYKKVFENFNKQNKELSERIDYYLDSYKQLNI